MIKSFTPTKQEIDREKKGFLLYTNKDGNVNPSTPQGNENGAGRISNALSRAIAYERTPSLFDTDEIKNRDRELRELQELKEADIKLCIDRKDKPVVLTSIQTRILFALNYAISQEIGTSEDVIDKIRGGKIVIKRDLNITALTALIFGSTRKRNKDTIIRELHNLSRIRQVQILGTGDNVIKITAPFINLGIMIEDLSTEKRNNLDFVEVIFGRAFFHGLNNRYTIVTPKLFEVWRKNGRGTDLFSILLSSIFSVYWHYRQAANEAETRVRKDKANKNLSKAELLETIAQARKNAMTYELNVSRIKNRVTTDYETTRAQKARFWTDLNNAIDGFKEMGLITEAQVLKGARGQEKVIFCLDEHYNFADPEEENTPLLEDKENGGRLSAF